MATVSYRLEDLKKAIVGIGYVGENDHMHVLIDCKEVFDEYPDAVPTMAIVPPVGEGYPKAVTRDGDVVEWLVKDSDVTVEGDGEFQLTFTEGEIIRKSVNARFRVKRSISGSGSAPSGVLDWLTDANEKLAEVEEATRDAEAAANHKPYIGIDGYWYTWNGEEFVKNVKAQGEKGDPGDPGSPGDPTQLIDDTAGEGQTEKTWSADKLDEEFGSVLSAIHGLEDQLFCEIDKPYEDDEKENILTDSMRSQGSVTNPSSSKNVIYEVPIEANARMWFVALDDDIILNRYDGNVSIAKDGGTFIPVNIYKKHFSFTSYDVPATLRITLKRKDESDLSASENVFGNMFLYKTEVKEDVTDLTKLTQGYYSFAIQDRDGVVNSKSFVESTKRVIYTIPINTDSGYQITPPTGCVIREVIIYNNEKGYVYCQTASISKGVFPILKGFGEGDYIQVLLAKSNANDNLSVSECSSIVVEEVK